MKTLDRLLSLFLLIVLTLFGVIVVATIAANWDRLPAAGEAVGDFVGTVADLVLLCLRLVLVFGIVAAVGAGIRFGVRWWYEYNQQRDGSHRLRTYRLRDAVTGSRVKVLVNPDLMVTPALAIGDHGVRELGALSPEIYAANANARARVAAVQAAAPGDGAITTSNGSMYRLGGLGGLGRIVNGNGRADRNLLANDATSPTASPDEAMPAAPPMQLIDALRSSSPDQFVLGYNPAPKTPNMALAVWRPHEHLNLGVFGVTGTGKTKSTGYHAMLLAARHGYHVVCLDPKGGVDFGAFKPYVEWQPTDGYTFPDQIAALEAVHTERHRLLRDYDLPDWRALGRQAGPEIVVVLEEFGALRQDIASRKGGGRALTRVDSAVEMMFRLARMTGFHFIVLDQAPGALDSVVLGGLKLRLAYQLDSSDATRLKEYEADQLPPAGAFMVRRVQYQSWLVETELARLTRSLPPFGHVRLLPAPTEQPNTPPNATERHSPEVANDRTPPNAPNGGEGSATTPPLPEPPFDVRSAPKRDVIWWWRDQHPTGSQAAFRAWLAQRNGDIAKGYISDMFAAWEAARPADGRSTGTAAPTSADATTLEALRLQGEQIRFVGLGGATYGWDETGGRKRDRKDK